MSALLIMKADTQQSFCIPEKPVSRLCKPKCSQQTQWNQTTARYILKQFQRCINQTTDRCNTGFRNGENSAHHVCPRCGTVIRRTAQNSRICCRGLRRFPFFRQQLPDIDPVKLRKIDQNIRIRHIDVRFPSGNRAIGHTQLFRKLLLLQAMFLAKLLQKIQDTEREF